MSIEDFLAFEREAEERHEFVGGSIHAMTGASLRHNRITGNIYRKLAERAAGSPCRVYIENAKLRILDDAIYYPDVMVVCGPESGDDYFETEPCLIVEVASPSTEKTDRREKFALYRNIPSLRSYFIVEQNRRAVEHFARDDDGFWKSGAHFEEGTFTLPCPPGTKLSLQEIYEGL